MQRVLKGEEYKLKYSGMLLSVTGSGLCGLGVVVKQGQLPGLVPLLGVVGMLPQELALATL